MGGFKMKNRVNLPIAKRPTKFPKQSRMSKRNEEMLKKIERWKARFG